MPQSSESDDVVVRALADFDDALAGSDPANIRSEISGELDAQLAARIERAQDCLRKLESLWPRRRSAASTQDTPPPADQTARHELGLLPVGAVLGDYRITEMLGVGGMGLVYRAEHRRMKRPVALKVLSPDVVWSSSARQRFEREVHAIAQLHHPNIVTAYDAREDNGQFYFVMELVEGDDLNRLVHSNGPLSVADAVNYTLQAARGLECAHRKGIVHRDIKPSNLLLDAQGAIKLLDLGLARVKEVGDPAQQPERTFTGVVLGTVDYMAPEQAADSKQADARSDIYSLGCTLFYLLAGRPPFSAATLLDKLLAHREQPVPSLAAVSADVSPQLQTVFAKMMAKAPENRYQSMSEVITDLQARLSETPASSADPRTNNKWPLLGGGLFGALLLAAAVFYLRPKDDALSNLAGPAGAVDPSRESAAVKPNNRLSDPTFQQWMKDVAALPAEQQITAVVKKLQELNPWFDGQHEHAIADGVVTEFHFNVDNVRDISPLRALAQLKVLGCAGSSTSNGQASDLSPLRGMLLAKLSAHDMPVTDLRPLAGMPLEGLSIGHTLVSDLSPLRGMRLTDLYCDSTSVSDLSPLQEMPLKELHCDDTRISDLSPLGETPLTLLSFTPSKITRGIDVIKKMKTLHTIGFGWQERHQFPAVEFWKKYDAGELGKPITTLGDPTFQQWMRDAAALPAKEQLNAVVKKLRQFNPDFDGTVTHEIEGGVVTRLQFVSDHVTDISPVRALAKLRSLGCRASGLGKTKLSDLSPLTDMQLQSLDFGHSQVVDLSPLTGMPLINLRFRYTRVFDLSPLQGMPLATLDFASTPVSDLSPLRGMPLTTLDFACTRVFDMSPLRGMPLTELRCYFIPITDLSPLEGMPLTGLDCRYTRVSDLSPLKGMPLRELKFSQTRVSDLSPLRGMQLVACACDHTTVDDLSPLKDIPLARFHFTPQKITQGLAAIRGKESLKTIGLEWETPNEFPSDVFWKKYDAGEFAK